MKLGHIRIIDNKVKFEPDGLPEPNNIYYLFVPLREWCRAMKEYEASKQLIEVSNNNVISKDFPNIAYIKIGEEPTNSNQITNNTSCKAEITGKTCTIVELTK